MKHICQIKYLDYFEAILNGKVAIPKRFIVKKIKFTGMPLLSMNKK